MEDAAIDPRALAGSDAGVFIGMMLSEWGATEPPRLSRSHLASRLGGRLLHGRQSGVLPPQPDGPEPHRRHRVLVVVDGGAPRPCQALAPVTATWRSRRASTSCSPRRCRSSTRRPGCPRRTAPVNRSAPRPMASDAARVLASSCSVAWRTRWPTVMPVYAVIDRQRRQQDGHSSGITAPNRWAQAAGDRSARWTGPALVRTRRSTFVEAHGTGTTLGDMIEANALGDLHGVRPRPRRACWAPSRATSGTPRARPASPDSSSVVLSLHHRVVPPSRFADTRERATSARRTADCDCFQNRWTLPSETAYRSRLQLRYRWVRTATSCSPVRLATRARRRRLTESSRWGVLTLSADNRDSLRLNAIHTRERHRDRAPLRWHSCAGRPTRSRQPARPGWRSSSPTAPRPSPPSANGDYRDRHR